MEISLVFRVFNPLLRSASRVQASSGDWLVDCRRMFQTSKQAMKKLANFVATDLMIHEDMMCSSLMRGVGGMGGMQISIFTINSPIWYILQMLHISSLLCSYSGPYRSRLCLPSRTLRAIWRSGDHS